MGTTSLCITRQVYVQVTSQSVEQLISISFLWYGFCQGSIDESSATGEKNEVFDSSHKRGRPLNFVLGAGRVIQGWDMVRQGELFLDVRFE